MPGTPLSRVRQLEAKADHVDNTYVVDECNGENVTDTSSESDSEEQSETANLL